MKFDRDTIFKELEVQCCGHTCTDKGVVPVEDYEKYMEEHKTTEHNYTVETEMACRPGASSQELQALRQKVFDTMSSEAQYQAPASKEFLHTPLSKGDCCTKLTLIQNDDVVVQRCDQTYTLTNHTLPGHTFHPGYIQRSVVIEDHCVKVVTNGRGVGPCAGINKRDGPHIFKLIDLRVKKDLGFDLTVSDWYHCAVAIEKIGPLFSDAGLAYQALWERPLVPPPYPVSPPTPREVENAACVVEQEIRNPNNVTDDMRRAGLLPTVPIFPGPDPKK